MPFAVVTENLGHRFGKHVAVQDVSLRVPRGCVYGFLGHNGAGKTTTLKMLAGILRPCTGRIRVNGLDPQAERVRAAARTGLLLDAHGFYPHLSGRANLDLCRRLHGLPHAEIDRVLDIAGMRASAGRAFSTYSLGMRQRLGVARALLGNPAVLILDEPANGLDPEGIADMRELLRSLPQRSGATVILSSHQLDETERVASHVGILARGRLRCQGSLSELLAAQGGEVSVATDAAARSGELIAALGLAVRHDAGSPVLHVSAGPGHRLIDSAAAIARTLVRAGVAVHAITPAPSSLETLYRRCTAPIDTPAGNRPT